MKTALAHMLVNEDTLADEFDAIIGYRTSHAGIVRPGVSYTPSFVNFTPSYPRYLSRTSALANMPASAQSFTICFRGKFSNNRDASSAVLLLTNLGLADASELLRVARAGDHIAVAVKIGGTVLYSQRIFGTLSFPDAANLLFAMSCDGTTGKMAIYDGASWTVETSYLVTPASAPWAVNGDRHFIGIDQGLTTRAMYANIADLYARFASDTSAYIDLATSARDVLVTDPGADGTGFGLGTPQIFFTGNATGWASGNAGNGGAYTVTHAVANAPETVTYTQHPVQFTRATPNYLQATVSGLSDTATFTLSFWLRMTSNDAATHVLFRLDSGGATGQVLVTRSGTNVIALTILDSAGTTLHAGSISTVTFTTADTSLSHVLITGDAARNGGLGGLFCYVNGAVQTAANDALYNNAAGNVGLSASTRCWIGAGNAAANPIGGQLADFWMSNTFTAASEVAGFYNGGTPPDLLFNGRGHTQSAAHQPMVFFGQRSQADADDTGDTAKGWNDGFNRGTLTGFVMTNSVSDV